jgi:hypothetical protein
MTRRSTFGAILFAFALAACEPNEQLAPVDTSVLLFWSNPLGLEYEGPLRYAVVWTLTPEGDNADPIADARAVWMADGVVPGPVFEVPLVVPPAHVLNNAWPQERLELERNRTTPCFRPRVVLYEDTDGTGRFSPPAFQSPGYDRVLAVDSGSSVCALLDLETALDGASLELTETYYVATSYLFTPFAPVQSSGGLTLRLDDAPLALQLTDSPTPLTSLQCLRRASLAAPTFFPTSRVSAHVDVGLDAGTLCSAIFPECVSEDLATLEAPVIDPQASGAVVETFGCRKTERFEVFIAAEGRVECRDCSCYTRAHSEVFFAAPESLPAWWPCDTQVPYCESDLPLYTLDPLCDLTLLE